MNRAPYDLRDYLLDELTADQRAEVERHLEASAAAREELERLRLTHQALRSLPNEEPPRRIAFVSDKVFEPSPWKRLWQGLWGAAPRFAMAASALVLAVSLGLWITEPTVTTDENGWRIAFGAETVPAPSPAQPAAMTPEQVRAAVLEVLEASRVEREARQRQVLAELIAEESEESRELWKQEIRQLRQETEDAWFMLKGRIDSVDRGLAGVNLAWERE